MALTRPRRWRALCGPPSRNLLRTGIGVTGLSLCVVLWQQCFTCMQPILHCAAQLHALVVHTPLVSLDPMFCPRCAVCALHVMECASQTVSLPEVPSSLLVPLVLQRTSLPSECPSLA